MKIIVPVLLIGFNRPDTIFQVFEKIREVRPNILYVSIDGPREEVKGENILVNKVKEIVKNVDWPCKANFNFYNSNKGAEVNISSAISWVFINEKYVIVLEDDIIAPLSFFRFSQQMLIRYKNDNNFGFITGNNFTPIKDNVDYYFTRHGHFWGWATWKRVWKNFDLNIKIPEEHTSKEYLTKRTNSKLEYKYYKKIFIGFIKKGPGNISWDKVALYMQRRDNLLTITPRVNLTSNIGTFGLHAQGKTNIHYLPFDENFKIKFHPAEIKLHPYYDNYHFRKYIYKGHFLFNRFLRKATKVYKKFLNLTV